MTTSPQVSRLAYEPSGRLMRLLDSARPWGSFQVGYARYGLRTCRLVVYPPGINRSERVALRLWRAWPIAGALLGLLTVFLLLPSLWGAVLVATGYVTVATLLARRARRTRRGVRQEMAIEGVADVDDGRSGHVRHLASLLEQADHALDSGQITPAEYENVWTMVYAQLSGSTYARRR